MYELGIDIGGTFTDLVLLDPATGRSWFEKVLTTPADPSAGASLGIRKILGAAGVKAEALRRIVHGTTLVINTIIERKGCRTGLITTEGFGDVLEMRRGRRFDMDDLLIEVPVPLVPRSLVREARERMSKDGVPFVPIDERSVTAATRSLVDAGVESIAICFLHSYRNGDHEKRARMLVEQIAPDIHVSLSSDVAPDIREYERASTTVANAYTQPVFERYLSAFGRSLSEAGYKRQLYLMTSDAGLTTSDLALRAPVRLIESGPAGGCAAARHVGSVAERDGLVAFDMGGTTAKVSFIANGRFSVASELEVARAYRFKKGSGLPIRIPTVHMIEIGAGGGGIASVNDLGLLRVGPQSAGADPGPACYGRGGAAATVTDANLLLGYLDPDFFLGGEMRLETAAARKAVEDIAARLNLDAIRVAWGIHEIVSTDMAEAARLHLLDLGVDPRKFAMLAFGGAGPLHACRVARKLGVREVIIPEGAGVLSALGFLVAPIAVTMIQGHPALLEQADADEIDTILARLETQGREVVIGTGADPQRVELNRFALLRYQGQGTELRVPIPPSRSMSDTLPSLQTAFHEEYARVYGRRNPAIAVEAVSWGVTASAPLPRLEIKGRSFAGEKNNASSRCRPVYFAEAGAFTDCPVFQRSSLMHGRSVNGPALIAEAETSTVVPPQSTVQVDAYGNLRVSLH